jgi:hypothetical protein
MVRIIVQDVVELVSLGAFGAALLFLASGMMA